MSPANCTFVACVTAQITTNPEGYKCAAAYGKIGRITLNAGGWRGTSIPERYKRAAVYGKMHFHPTTRRKLR